MDLRINEIESKMQPFERQDQLRRMVREEIRAWKEEEERDKRAAAERNLSSGISDND